MAKDPYKYFRIEARELLDQLAQGVLALERGAPAAEGVPVLLRHAHTLKGAARVVRQPAIADAAHRLEDVLVPFREAPGALPPERLAALLAGVADIEARLAELPPVEGAAPAAAPGSSGTSSSNPSSNPSGAPPAPAAEAVRSLRTDLADLDALLAGLARTQEQVAELRRSRDDAAAARALVRKLLGQWPTAAAAGTARAVRPLAEELNAAIDRLDRDLGTSAERIERELGQLQERAERLRLVGIDSIYDRLERTARDVAAAQGKQVVFEGRATDVRLDAAMLAPVQDALVQLVRNAVAHGIEPPDARAAAGKPRAGRVVVDVQRLGREVSFRCADDGAGIDLEAVRRSAERAGRGPVPPDADGLLRLLLRGGVSTAEVVSEVSGRGVGLDVARDTAARLGGALSARTAAGQGATLELRVPLSVAAVEVLGVEAAGAPAAVSLEALRGTLRLEPADIVRSGTRESVLHDGRTVPYVALARLLGGAAPDAQRRVSALIVEHDGLRAAIGVDRLREVAGVMLRPLPELAPPCALVAGVALALDGTPRLVLDAGALVRAAAQSQAPARQAPGVPDPVLVVDDSLTTRMLETSILESAGYTVDAATSAEEALACARRRRYALFLVDVEMPGMDGFTFVERTRADPALRDIPAVLISSRNTPADHQRAAAAGAAGYIVKGEFVQSEFLARVRQLVRVP